MTINAIQKALQSNVMFSDASEEVLRLISEKAELRSFPAKAVIPCRRELGVITEGKIAVHKHDLLMRILQTGDSFGVATLFAAQSESVSQLQALCRTEVAFISEALLNELFRADFALVQRYIAFQADRICYLNKRLEECSGNSVNAKLAAFLHNAAQAQRSEQLRLNLSKTAANLNIGRASLYRALNRLEADGIVSRDGNSITIADKQALEKIIRNEEC